MREGPRSGTAVNARGEEGREGLGLAQVKPTVCPHCGGPPTEGENKIYDAWDHTDLIEMRYPKENLRIFIEERVHLYGL